MVLLQGLKKTISIRNLVSNFFNALLMKITKNIFWILSLSVLFLISCDRNKFLTKLVETSADGSAKTTLYTYKGNEILSIDGNEIHDDFVYNNGLISKIVTTDKLSQRKTTMVYTYDKKMLVRAECLNEYSISYLHNQDGTISFEKKALNPETKLYHGTLTFKNNNIIKEERVIDSSAAGMVATHTLSFEYDTKKNPLHSIMGYEKLLDQSNLISLNNSVISVVTTTETKADQTISSANFYKNTFKYDENDYPLERVSEAVMPAKGKSYYLKSEYFY